MAKKPRKVKVEPFIADGVAAALLCAFPFARHDRVRDLDFEIKDLKAVIEIRSSAKEMKAQRAHYRKMWKSRYRPTPVDYDRHIATGQSALSCLDKPEFAKLLAGVGSDDATRLLAVIRERLTISAQQQTDAAAQHAKQQDPKFDFMTVAPAAGMLRMRSSLEMLRNELKLKEEERDKLIKWDAIVGTVTDAIRNATIEKEA